MCALAVKYNFKSEIKYLQQSKVFELKQKSKNGKKRKKNRYKCCFSPHFLIGTKIINWLPQSWNNTMLSKNFLVYGTVTFGQMKSQKKKTNENRKNGNEGRCWVETADKNDACIIYV